MSDLADRAAAMRAAFDRGFAEPPAAAAALTSDFLAIRAGGQLRAIALAEISGLFVDRRVTPIPTPAVGLLGLAGFRGAMVPVYDLRVLLGANPVEHPRWIVIAAATAVGFAFDGFDGHLRVARAGIAGGMVDVITSDGVARAIVPLTELVAELERRASGADSRETREK